jgi:hypothetical protein
MSRCEKCYGGTEQVYHAAKQVVKGWYCVKCDHMTKSIGRERQLPLEKSITESTSATPQRKE